MIIYYVLCFPFFQKKDFNFSTPNRGLGLKTTLKTKTNVLVSNNFLEINQNGLSPINPLPQKRTVFMVSNFLDVNL